MQVFGRESADRRTHRWKDGSNSMTSTADAGGNNVNKVNNTVSYL